MEKFFEIIVVGGGHAGVEAALAAARMGCKTALLSLDASKIGEMSCNPAIGGLGKGQLVKEIDALHGEMGVAIDATGIQFRELNSSKGPAVRSSRAQADRNLYRQQIQDILSSQPNLTVIEAAAGELILEGDSIKGIITESQRISGIEKLGERIEAKAVILTTGTFLGGLMHTGESQTVGGRVGERASYNLSDSLRSLGLRMSRMKTGTPPRLQLSSINFSILEEQPGDIPIKPFSFRTKEITRPQISCWITHTNSKTHEYILNDIERSPMFNGQIQSRGPRYCPSLEDKIFRFKDKETHQIFLEPEGFDSDVVYPNGISTSLPADTQEKFVRSIRGLENVKILRLGYAVEYDHVDPTELDSTLKVKSFNGLYLAGQINGTSGYEEAAAQGIIAGINAALFVKERAPFVLRRDEAYIAVMIDDLTTLGVMEPYRMFTSRAEYRLHLREDNADLRLTPYARELGLVDDLSWNRFEERREKLTRGKEYLENFFIKPTAENNQWLTSLGSANLSDAISLQQLLKRPEVSLEVINKKYHPEFEQSFFEIQSLETEVKFAGYLKRQELDIKRLQQMENVTLPLDFPYSELKSLSIEVRERLCQVRPQTLGQASRVSGVTQAALSLIAIYLKKNEQAFNQRTRQVELGKY